MSLTTRPPGPASGAGIPEPAAPIVREIEALIDEIRALAGPKGALPPLADTRATANETAIGRWARAALEAGFTPAALRTIIDQAVARRVAVVAEARPVEAARQALVRVLSIEPEAAPEPPLAAAPSDAALALRVLVDAVQSEVLGRTGLEPVMNPALIAGGDPRNAGAAILAALRTVAARAGVAPETLGPAVEAAVSRALAGLPATPLTAATIEGARDVLVRGLGGPSVVESGPLPLLAREIRSALAAVLGEGATIAAPPATTGDAEGTARALIGWVRAVAGRLAPEQVEQAVELGTARALTVVARSGGAPAARALVGETATLVTRGLALPMARPELAARVAAPRESDASRVLPVGEEEREPPQPAPGTAAREAPAGAPGPIEGPMQCVRRLLDALFAGDTAAFLAQWTYPACFWIDGRWVGCNDAGELAALHRRLARAREAGRVLLLRVDPVSPSLALVHALTHQPSQDGGREVETLYTTVLADGEWKAAVSAAK